MVPENRTLRFGIIIMIMISIPALARVGISSEFQTWSDIATIYKFSDNWRYDGDQGIRGVLSGNDFNLLYFRPSVRYRFKPWFTVHGGIRFFYMSWEDPEDTFEIGPCRGFESPGPKSENGPSPTTFDWNKGGSDRHKAGMKPLFSFDRAINWAPDHRIMMFYSKTEYS